MKHKQKQTKNIYIYINKNIKVNNRSNNQTNNDLSMANERNRRNQNRHHSIDSSQASTTA